MKNKRSLLGICIVSALACLFLTEAVAQEARKIVVLPFEVHSRANAVQIQEAIARGLTAELQKSKNIQVVDKDAVDAATAGGKPRLRVLFRIELNQLHPIRRNIGEK